MRKMIMIAVLAAVGMAVFGQEKPKLGIFPFTGGTEQERQTIAKLFSNSKDLMDAFDILSRTNAAEAVASEQDFQRSELAKLDTVAKLDELEEAQYVVSGHITRLGNANLLLISIVEVKTMRLITGDYRKYEKIDEANDLLPKMARNIVESFRNQAASKTGERTLAVRPLSIEDPSVNKDDAELLAQIVAIEIANSRKYAVYPRTKMIETAEAELDIWRSGLTGRTSVEGVGKAPNPEYVLAGTITNLGSTNQFYTEILNMKVVGITNASREYRNLEDGIDIMCKLAYDLTRVKTERYLEIEARETDRAKAETARKTKQRNLDVWANSRFYAGLRVGVSPRFYGLSDDISTGKTETGASFEAAAQFSVHALGLSVGSFDIEIGGQMELWFGMDAVSYSGTDSAGDFSASFTSSSLAIPLLAKASYRISDKFMVSLFTGPYFSIPLGELTYTNGESSDSYKVNIPAGWLIGIAPGLRLGPGTLFADIRYGGDFGNTSISDSNGTLSIYSRSAFSFALGYEFGFIER